MQERELQHRDGVYARRIRVSEEMVDEKGNMTILAVASVMQEAAGDQLIDLGIGFDVTSVQGLLWVVVWSEFHFTTLPKLGDEVTFYTWPGKKMHWFYPRRAYAFDANGEELLYGSYLWMLMDAKSRKVTEDNGVLGTLPALTVESECKIPSMKCVFPESLSNSCMRTVDAQEVDDNRHLNNAHYLDWTSDLAIASGFSMVDLQTLWINYKKEILPGETVTLWYERTGSTLYVSGMGTEEHFIAKLVFNA